MRVAYGDKHIIVEFHRDDTTLEFAKAIVKVMEWLELEVDLRVEAYRVRITMRKNNHWNK